MLDVSLSVHIYACLTQRTYIHILMYTYIRARMARFAYIKNSSTRGATVRSKAKATKVLKNSSTRGATVRSKAKAPKVLM